jgi:hypothetical protein
VANLNPVLVSIVRLFLKNVDFIILVFIYFIGFNLQSIPDAQFSFQNIMQITYWYIRQAREKNHQQMLWNISIFRTLSPKIGFSILD